MKSLLMTGISSFTGCHIARSFADQGWKIYGTLTRPQKDYGGALIQKRLHQAQATELIEDCPLGSEKMLSFVRENKLELFINHGAFIQGYREPNFNAIPSLEQSLHNLSLVCSTLKTSGCQRIIHSGSIFEPDEGGPEAGQSLSSEAVSIYGVTKAMLWQALRYYARFNDIALSKIIIPDPIGAYENEDRMIPFFVKEWMAGRSPILKSPDLIRDRIPAQWLARFYVEEAQSAELSAIRIRRPSAFVMSHKDFVELFIKKWNALRARKDSVRIESHPTKEPLSRVNTEACSELKNSQEIEKFWKDWIQNLEGSFS